MNKLTLKNGLTLMTEHNPNATFFALSVVVKTGSFYEKGWSKGISHLTEHMLFKGTEKRTYKEINNEVTRHGGHLNAMTTFDFTRYYTVVPYYKWELATDLLSDMLFHSTIPEEELKKEKNVVMDEIKMYEDDPSAFCQDQLQKQMFPGEKECHNILGNVRSVKSTSRAEILRYIQTYYVPSNMAFIASGNVDVASLIAMLEQLDIPSDRRESFVEAYEVKTRQIEKQETFTYKRRVEQASLSWGVFGPSISDPDFFAYQLLYTLLGESPNSRLYSEIREEKGIAYDIYMGESSIPGQSVLFGHLGTEAKNILEAKKLILQEFSKVSRELIDESELTDLKNYIQGLYLIQMNEVSFINDYMMNCYLCGQFIDKETYLNCISKVTSEQIRQVANRYFKPDNILFLQVVPK